MTDAPSTGAVSGVDQHLGSLSAEYEQFRYHLPAGLIELELPSARVTYLNRLAEVLLGYTMEDVLGGIAGQRLVTPESWALLGAQLERDFSQTVRKGLAYGRQPGQQAHRITALRKDGTRFPAEVQGSYIVDAAGVPTGVRILFRDISDRVAQEQEHARLAAIVASADAAIVSRDLEGRILSWNEGAERLYGWTAAEMVGRTADVLAPPGQESEIADLTERVLAGERLQIVTKRKRRDGTIFDVDLSLFPVRGEGGRVVAIGGIARDVTESLRTRRELERTNQLLEALSRAQIDFIRNGDPAAVFGALLDLVIELTESEYGFIGEVFRHPDGTPYLWTRSLSISAVPEFPEFARPYLERGFTFDNLDTLFGYTLRTGEPVIANNVGSDPRAGGTPPGHPPLLTYLGLPITSRGELIGMIGLANRPGGYSEEAIAFLRPLLTTSATLIEALRTERQRAEAQERLETALEHSQLVFWEWDIPARTLMGFGVGEGGMLPGPVRMEQWLEYVHPADREAVRAAFAAHAAGEADGIDIEHRYLAPGGAVRWTLTRGRASERRPDGRPLRAVGTFLDITARKEAELERERLQLQIRQAQKLESLGVLAGGIAHDFNNLLTVVLGNLYLLEQSLPPDPASAELLDDARNAAERGADLVRRLLAFGRPEVEQPEIVDLDRLIAEAAALARRMLEPHVRLVVRKAHGTALVSGSATALEQVLLNLFVNARDAMPSGGVVTVSRSSVDLAARRRWAPPELARGRYHVIAVRDTGTGIAPEVLEKIFDPFFTTKPVGRGSGLGLPTALAIARAHRGWLSAESTPGKGSTFRLLLPVFKEHPAG